MKLYVKEIVEKNKDGDKLITVKTYDSKPMEPFYVVWLP